MSTTQRLEQDLSYVKKAVERHQTDQRTPLGIALIWAAFALVGFTWLDFQPGRAAWFFTIGSPIAFLASWKIGGRAAWKLGECDRISGWLQFQHWGSGFFAFAAVLSLAFAGRIGGELLGQVILIMFGLVYFLAGVHFSARLFLWLGLLMMAGAVGLTYIDRWGWTTMGVLLSVGLIASSFMGARRLA